jgi:glycosyltransferase involved in cell wall biosynthesis
METAIRKKVLVSICIPCHNASHFLSDTLNSLVNQSHRELEIIIIDDHSIDESVKIIEQFAQQDSRIKFSSSTKKGAAPARNQAYNQATGEFIIFFDADDWVPTNFITTQLNNIVNKNDVVVAKWGRFYNNINNVIINKNQIQQDLTFTEWITKYWINASHMTCPGRVLIPKSLIEKAGVWNESLSLNDDFTFYTKIFSLSNSIRFNKDSLFHYRSGNNGLSSKKGKLEYQSFYESLRQGISTAKSQLPECKQSNICYANLLQNFIYEVYPFEPELLKKASAQILLLGGATFEFPAGGKTKMIVNILGWKLTKKIKTLLKI